MPSPLHTPADSAQLDWSHSGQDEPSRHQDSPQLDDENSVGHEVDDHHPAPSQPQQKRRRVTRACDECRRKKIKCDGKQPCTHCTVYTYECTYDQPSNRKRNFTPQYIESLESQLKRAKALLQIVFPTVNLNESSIDHPFKHALLPQVPTVSPQPIMLTNDVRVVQQQDLSAFDDEPKSPQEAMVMATCQLDLDEEGNVEYYGRSSGPSFISGLRKFDDMFQIPSDRTASSRFCKSSQIPHLPRPQSPGKILDTMVLGKDLPDREQARKLCDIAITDACAMFRVVHMPTFYNQFDHIYDTPFESYGSRENSYLPLLYAVLALGKLFSRCDENLDDSSYDALIEESYGLFTLSRQSLDMTECRDLTSLQAIVFMTKFLQSLAKLDTCYAYIGVALRSALRMGLHRSFSGDFTPIEAETRKRLFWAIRRMDICVGTMLGLPRFVGDEDIDQAWPLEVDDEYITDTEILSMPTGSVSVMAAFNAHTKIVRIVDKICKYVYPTQGSRWSGNHSMTYKVSYSKISELEQDLSEWLDELPMGLRPGGEAPPIILRVQQLLRMAFGNAQLLLYRPFLHYVSKKYKNNVDQRAFAFAAACVGVSRNVVHIATEIRKRGLHGGASWFFMHTTFFAVVSILYFVTENSEFPTSFEILGDAVEGKEVLAYFARRSVVADRFSSTLKTMFEKLPESIRHGGDIIQSKKRRQASSPRPFASRPCLFKEDIQNQHHLSNLLEGVPDVKPITHGHILPLSSTHLANLGLDPACNSHSPPNGGFFDTIPVLTPTLSSVSLGETCLPSTPGVQQSLKFPPTPPSGMLADSLELNAPTSEMPTMLLDPTDPLAYTTQPTTIFENKRQQAFDCNTHSPAFSAHIRPYSAMFAPTILPPVGLERSYNTSDAQLFKNVPMHLMQGANPYREIERLKSKNPPLQMPGFNLQFDDLLSYDQWENALLEPAPNIEDPRPPLGSSHRHQEADSSHWRAVGLT